MVSEPVPESVQALRVVLCCLPVDLQGPQAAGSSTAAQPHVRGGGDYTCCLLVEEGPLLLRLLKHQVRAGGRGGGVSV